MLISKKERERQRKHTSWSNTAFSLSSSLSLLAAGSPRHRGRQFWALPRWHGGGTRARPPADGGQPAVIMPKEKPGPQHIKPNHLMTHIRTYLKWTCFKKNKQNKQKKLHRHVLECLSGFASQRVHAAALFFSPLPFASQNKMNTLTQQFGGCVSSSHVQCKYLNHSPSG